MLNLIENMKVHFYGHMDFLKPVFSHYFRNLITEIMAK